MRRSEKALGRTESILPARSFSLAGLFRSQGSPYAPWQRNLAIGGTVAVLLVGGLAINNEYVRRHRTLHVLNATGNTVQVAVDDQPAVPVNGLGSLTVPEGAHVIKVSGPVNETQTIALDSGYFERWTNSPVWILNPGGEAVVQESTHIYSANGTPGNTQLLVGESFLHRPHVDYVFTNAPTELQVKNKNQEVVKSEIGWLQGDDLAAFESTIDVNRKAAMDFAEKRLRRNPNQSQLLKDYVEGGREEERDRIESFLKSGLDRRPVDVAWHRAYQTLAEFNNHEDELISQYEKFLAADPTSAPLIYLRGRIAPDWKQQESYYRRAVEADPKLGWPWMGLAAHACSEGLWDDCMTAALKARALNVNEAEQISALLHEARLAKGEAGPLIEEYQARVNANPQNVESLLYLVDAQAAAGKDGEIEKTINAAIARLPGPVQAQLAPHLRALGLYYAGKLKECAEFCHTNAQVKPTPVHFNALLALDRIEDATDDSLFKKLWQNPLNLLEASVGFGLDGKTEESAHCRKDAMSLLNKLGGATSLGKAAKLLSAPEPPSIAEVRQVYFPPADKRLILAALADQFPARRDEYLAEAARFNNSHKAPYHLIRRVLARKTNPQP